MKLTSELQNEQKRVQELVQRVAGLELTDDAFKRTRDDVKKKDEKIKELKSKIKLEQQQKKKQAEELGILKD